MREVVYRAVTAAVRGVYAALGLRFDVRGVEHLPPTGPVVIASNHVGYLDFTFVAKAALLRGRYVRFMTKSAVFDSRLSGATMRSMRHIPVVRGAGAGAYRQGLRLLGAGEAVGVFPESTISRSWLLKPFADGAAGLARETGAPLVPIVVWGGHRVLTVDGRWSRRRGVQVVVRVGPAVAVHPAGTVAEATEDLRTRMAAMLAEVQRDYPQTPRDAGDRWWLPESLGGTAPSPGEAARLDDEALARARVRQDRRFERKR